ncbi:6471_t:CDS:2, partial [Acaulospora colombiana]
MTEQYESALHRIPGEIWSIILDEAIDLHNPLFFSTTFEGSDWSAYSIRRSFEQEEALQDRAEMQRKIIGSVCRSWQSFSRSRRSRYVRLTIDRVGLHCPELVRGFNWEI